MGYPRGKRKCKSETPIIIDYQENGWDERPKCGVSGCTNYAQHLGLYKNGDIPRARHRYIFEKTYIKTVTGETELLSLKVRIPLCNKCHIDITCEKFMEKTGARDIKTFVDIKKWKEQQKELKRVPNLEIFFN